MGWQGTSARQHNDFISLPSIHRNTMEGMMWGGIEEKEVVLL
jgi:hypothetical protein